MVDSPSRLETDDTIIRQNIEKEKCLKWNGICIDRVALMAAMGGEDQGVTLLALR